MSHTTVMGSAALLLLLVLVASPTFAYRRSLFADQPCQMRSGKAGICRPITDCSSALLAIQQGGVWPVNCGFQGREPIVCCEKRSGNSLPATLTPTIPTTITSRGRKSEEACQAYANELPVGVRTNVIDGEQVFQGEMPHMAALGFADTKGGAVSWDCGGSLISDRYVLTAAHCFRRRDKRLLKVRLGGVQLTSRTEGAEEVPVEKVTLHPEFRSPYNDIALIRLARVVRFSETLAPACLYTAPQLPPDALVVAGWGATDRLGDDKSDFLLKAIVQNMETTRCNDFHKGNPKLRRGVIESMMCAYDPQRRKDTCSGDSGGPLQALTADVSNVYSIIGITSFGSSVCASSTPAIYTKVSSYVPWIEGIVWP